MSTNSSASIKTAIIGGGCAGYSLARKAAAFDGVTVLLAGKEKRQDHSWGFLLMKIPLKPVLLRVRHGTVGR